MPMFVLLRLAARLNLKNLRVNCETVETRAGP